MIQHWKPKKQYFSEGLRKRGIFWHKKARHFWSMCPQSASHLFRGSLRGNSIIETLGNLFNKGSHKVLKATWWFCFEITEQSIERFLIVVMVFPHGKVPNVACAPNIGWPCLSGGHNGIL